MDELTKQAIEYLTNDFYGDIIIQAGSVLKWSPDRSGGCAINDGIIHNACTLCERARGPCRNSDGAWVYASETE